MDSLWNIDQNVNAPPPPTTNNTPITTQLLQLQQNFAIELDQKQKIIEEQQELLLQLQQSIQETRDGKYLQPHQDQSSQIKNNNVQDIWDVMHSTQQEQTQDNSQNNSNKHKYDNFIEQQLLKDKFNNIRKFSGNKYDDIDEWLENIEHDFSSTLVSNEIKLKLIPKSLTNDAKNWFEQNKHRIMSWKNFKTEIQNRFQSSLHKDQKFIRLRERKQQLKETGQQFIDIIEKLCYQVNPLMTEEEKNVTYKSGT